MLHNDTAKASAKSSSEPIIKAELVRGLLSGVLAHGLDVMPYLERAEIDPAVLSQAGHPGVTTAQYIDLFYAIRQGLGDESLGGFSRPYKLGSFALTARVGMTAPDLREALRRMASTVNLLQDDLRFSLVENGKEAGIEMRQCNPDWQWQPFILYTMVRVYWRLGAWLIGGSLRIRHFDFATPAPAEAPEYAAAFPAERRYDQDASGFWFDSAQLHAPVIHDEQAMRAFLSDSFGQIISPPRTHGPISHAARNVLLRAYPQWPDVHAVAEHLHVSRATLQRQLAAEGTTLQQVKDNLRRDLAISRLSTSDIGLADIAAELGFSDSGSFQRAFKQWSGKACGEYRQAR
ncbi:MAG: AraC family transcriptional regulator ligand-binding domain-containing protein [Burkholderiaceae bacterium]|nr:AraC family transcriptional regulator ligand-binding domain-containing protein [Burkholderiaceae bacterium]